MSKQPASPQEQPPEVAQNFDTNNPSGTGEEKAALASESTTPEPAPAAPTTEQTPASQPQPVSSQTTQPVAGQPQPMGPMPPKQGMSKGLLWGLIGGGVGLVLLIIIVVVCIVLFSGPSTEDYRKAYAMMNSFDSASFNIDRSDPEGSIDEVVRKADDHFDKLGKTAAMRDGEVKKAFDNYKKSYENVKPLLGEVGAVAAASKQYSSSCRGSYSSPTGSASAEEAGQKYDEQQKSCLATLNKMKDSQYASVRDYANEQIKYRKDMRTYYVALINYYKNHEGDSPKRPDYPRTTLGKSLYDKLKDAQSSTKDSVRELRDILRTKGKIGRVAD